MVSPATFVCRFEINRPWLNVFKLIAISVAGEQLQTEGCDPADDERANQYSIRIGNLDPRVLCNNCTLPLFGQT